MLTILTKVTDEESLRYRIDRSIHKGTYLGGQWLADKVKSLELRAWMKRGSTWIDFPEDIMERPAVKNDTVVSEVKKEYVDKERGLYYGNPAFEYDGKLYPVQKGFATYIAYPSLELNVDYAIWSDEHKRWIDVTKYYECKKNVYVKEFILDANAIKPYERWNTVKRWHSKATNLVYKFLHTIDSCYLCLKYPFLYPRNRFTGNHYNNWKIIDYCDKLEKECVLHGRYKEWKDDSKNYQVDELPEVQSRKINEKYTLPAGKDKIYYFVDKDGQEVELYDPRHGDSPTIRLVWKYLEDGTLLRLTYFFNYKFGWVRVDAHPEVPSKYGDEQLNFDHDDYVTHYVNYIMDSRTYKKMTMIRWMHDKILARIFFIPMHSEIDAMDDGWFRAFGMQMLDELKAQLKKEKMLYKYRIMQIKEKYGDLRWYDAGSSDEVFNIIQKYSDISYHTCITCGRPADYITSGYILPLCKKHINPQDIESATDLHAPKKDNSEKDEEEL